MHPLMAGISRSQALSKCSDHHKQKGPRPVPDRRKLVELTHQAVAALPPHPTHPWSGADITQSTICTPNLALGHQIMTYSEHHNPGRQAGLLLLLPLLGLAAAGTPELEKSPPNLFLKCSPQTTVLTTSLRAHSGQQAEPSLAPLLGRGGHCCSCLVWRPGRGFIDQVVPWSQVLHSQEVLACQGEGLLAAANDGEGLSC